MKRFDFQLLYHVAAVFVIMVIMAFAVRNAVSFNPAGMKFYANGAEVKFDPHARIDRIDRILVDSSAAVWDTVVTLPPIHISK